MGLYTNDFDMKWDVLLDAAPTESADPGERNDQRKGLIAELSQMPKMIAFGTLDRLDIPDKEAVKAVLTAWYKQQEEQASAPQAPDPKEAAKAASQASKDFTQSMQDSSTGLSQMGRADLGSLLIWGLLSRGIGAYPQEGAFSAIHRGGLLEKLELVFQGTMTPTELRDWALLTAKGSPVGGAHRNVKAINAMVTAMMHEVDGRKTIDIMLDLWKSELSGPELRREVYRLFTKDRPSLQIQNKVLSFVILVSGRPDVMVLDRVQFRHLWGGEKLDKIIAELSVKMAAVKEATLKLRSIRKGSAQAKAAALEAEKAAAGESLADQIGAL